MTKYLIQCAAILILAVAMPARAQFTETFTFGGLTASVPDGNASGLIDTRTVTSSIASISSVKVKLKMAGNFNGDLYAYLSHSSGFSVLLNRPGKISSNAAGYDDSGFDITFQEGAVNGDIHLYRGVTTPAAGAPLTGVWQPDGRNLNPGTVLDTSPRTAGLNVFNAQNASGDWTLFVADLVAGGTNQLQSWEIQVTGQAAPVITWSNPADITYGTALGAAQLNASASVPGSFVYTPASGTFLNASNGQVLSAVFTPTDTGSYLKKTNTVTVNVLQQPLAVTAQNKSKIYGSANPTLTATYAGFVNGDTSASLDTPVSLSTTATDSSPFGTYPITPSAAADANYAISFFNGTLTVDKAELTITANNQSKTYGEANPTLTAAYSGFVNGDTSASLDTPVSLSTTATASSPAGTYPITPSAAADVNYIIGFVNGTLTVGKSGTAGLVASSTSLSQLGQTVTFSATLSAVAPGVGTPAGSVQFKVDGVAVGSPATLSGGVASVGINSITAGNHVVTAEYAGNANFFGTTNTLSGGLVVNAPPTVGADTLQRYAGYGVKVQISTLLANDTDSDGDPVVFQSVTNQSTGGGTVLLQGGWIHYTPPAGPSVADTFAYTAQDTRGGTNTGVITVQIQTDNAPTQNVAAQNLGNGSYRVRAYGIPGLDYLLQYSASLVTPTWLPLTTNSPGPLGFFEFVDSPDPVPPTRFYRSVLASP